MNNERNQDDNLKTNASGNRDQTAYSAIKNLEKEEARFKKLISTLVYICHCAGFKPHIKFQLEEKRTGRIWK